MTATVIITNWLTVVFWLGAAGATGWLLHEGWAMKKHYAIYQYFSQMAADHMAAWEYHRERDTLRDQKDADWHFGRQSAFSDAATVLTMGRADAFPVSMDPRHNPGQRPVAPASQAERGRYMPRRGTDRNVEPSE